jgi:hypothetical protein
MCRHPSMNYRCLATHSIELSSDLVS